MMRRRGLPRLPTSTESLERRPLRLVPLAPPDYLVAPTLLLNGCIEKDVIYTGTITGVPLDLEAQNRALMLAWVDRGYSSGQLGGQTEREAILSMSCYNVKLNCRSPPEELLLRLPTVSVESAVYVRDDHSHLVLLHHVAGESPAGPGEAWPTTSAGTGVGEAGDSGACLTVLQCDGRMGAEEVCALLRQAFQLLYTEATMQFFDRQVTAAGDQLSPVHSVAASSEAPPPPGSVHAAGEPGERLQEYMQPQDYMQALKSVLSPGGVDEFANYLRQWKAGHTPFRRFLQQLLRLFATVDATHLLVGLRPFLSRGDVPVFEDFLREQGLARGPPVLANGARGFRRAFSQSSTLSGASLRSGTTGVGPALSADEVERQLETALDEVRSLEAIVQGHIPLETVAKRLTAGEAPHCLVGALTTRTSR